MIDADKLIDNIDKFNAVRADERQQHVNQLVAQFDWAVKVMEAHREDIENAAKVIKHWGMSQFPVRLGISRIPVNLQNDRSRRAVFLYDESDNKPMRGGYITGNSPYIGWLSDGSIRAGWRHAELTVNEVRAGLLNDPNAKIGIKDDVSFYQVYNALVNLARWYDEMELDFVKYFETLGK